MKTIQQFSNLVVKQLLACILIFYSVCSYAILDIEITQGVDTAVPIAIYPFDVHTNDNTKLSNNYDVSVLNTVLGKDLYRSGLFISKQQSGQFNYQNINSSLIDKLQSEGIEYVVTGKININPYDRFEVSIELISLYQLLDIVRLSKDVNPEQATAIIQENMHQAVLLNKSYTVSGKYLRDLAHHLSDQVFEQLTGIKGVFASRIAYVNVVWKNNRDREYILEVADSDGYNPKRLLVSTEPIMSPSWHPNGKEIAYVSFAGNRSKINVIELQTGNVKTITSFKGINGAPAWSPNGSKMALVLSNEKVPKIYLADLTVGKLQQLTSGNAIDTEPRWAPDGKSIIFTSNRGGGPQIYSYDLETKKIQRLTYEGNYNARASFTPDGKKLVMIHRPDDTKGFKIAVQDLTTYNLDVLTDSDMDESPSVSANGQQIIYATKENNRGILAEVSIDGRVKIKRPASNGDVQEPAWSPYLG